MGMVSIVSIKPLEQAIQGGFPFLVGVVGARRDFMADPLDQFRADRFCVLARLFSFFAWFGLNRRSFAWLFGWGAHALPPPCGPTHGTVQLIGAVFVHRVISPEALARREDMPQVPQVHHKACSQRESTRVSLKCPCHGEASLDLLPRGVFRLRHPCRLTKDLSSRRERTMRVSTAEIEAQWSNEPAMPKKANG